MSRRQTRQNSFNFKRFSLSNERSAMKITTDGVILGAWADAVGCKRVLDVGTGTGLIALMVAQRNPDAIIDAVEIEPVAAEEAGANAKNSPWAGRIVVHNADFKTFRPEVRYDLIVSNPPYYNTGIKAPDSSRAMARHHDSLDFADILNRAGELLEDDGLISLIAPLSREDDIIFSATLAGLNVVRLAKFSSREGLEPSRMLIELSRMKVSAKYTSFAIHDSDGAYTSEFINMTKDFYINL